MISRGKLAQVFILLIIVAVSVILAAGIWRKKAQPVRKEATHSAPASEEMKLKDMKFTEMQEGKGTGRSTPRRQSISRTSRKPS